MFHSKFLQQVLDINVNLQQDLPHNLQYKKSNLLSPNKIKASSGNNLVH